MVTYRLVKVDGTDEDIADDIRWMHEVTFGSSAPMIHPEQGHWWIAHTTEGMNAGSLAGFCGLTLRPEEPHVAYLKRAGVLPEARGNGLQKRMVRVREALARKLGIKQLVTDTTDNIPSANNLIACGYKLYRPQAPWGFNNTLYWFKEIK